jgi:hypothetical protein
MIGVESLLGPNLKHVPSGYLTVCHGKSLFFISKPSISIRAISHGYVSHNQRVKPTHQMVGLVMLVGWIPGILDTKSITFFSAPCGETGSPFLDQPYDTVGDLFPHAQEN